MKLIAYISFTLAACVFVLGLLSGSLNIVEAFVLVAVGSISLAIGDLRDGQQIIEQNLKKISTSISGVENTILESENDAHGMVVRKRESPSTDEEIAEFLSSRPEP